MDHIMGQLELIVKKARNVPVLSQVASKTTKFLR